MAIEVGAPQVVATGTFHSVTPVARALTVVMALFVLVNVIDVVNDVVAIGVMRRVKDGRDVDDGELSAIDQRARMGVIALVALHITTIVLFCVFMPRANRNARALGGPPMQFTPGWAAGTFFVPIWSLYKPYQAMKEIWQGSDPDPRLSPLTITAPAFLAWWWGLFLADNVFGQIGRYMYRDVTTPAQFIDKCRFEIAAALLSTVAAVLAAIVVRAVAKRQDQRQRQHIQPA